MNYNVDEAYERMVDEYLDKEAAREWLDKQAPLDLKSTMKQGEISVDLNDKILRITCHFDERLAQFLKNFHHVDTYLRDNGDYRIQGHVSFSDLPTQLPDEFIRSDFKTVEKNGKLIFEVWNMAIKQDLPF